MNIKTKHNYHRIALYLPRFDKGGISKITINLINFFIKKKRNVILFSKNAKPSYFKKSKYLKIFNIKHKKTKFQNFFDSLTVAINLFKVIKKEDVILSMQNHFFIIVFNFLYKNKIIIRNSEEIFGATKYADKKISAVLVLSLKIILYQFVDKIIVLSKLSHKSIKKILINKNKVLLIKNPYIIKIKKFVKKKYTSNTKFSIISAGRLVKQKNYELLIKVINKINNDKISLTIIGSGYQKQFLKKITKNKNIKIIAWKKNLNPYFKNANLFILPSLYEGSPNVLLDAINNSIPILTSNCSGAQDIAEKKCGFIFKLNNLKDLKKKINYIINNYNFSLERAKRANLNLKKYTIDNSNSYLKLLD